MSRIPAINLEQATGQAQRLLQGVESKLGFAPNIMRTMANSPAVLQGYLGFSNALSKGNLSPKFREQIALAVSEINACQYCLAAHSTIGRSVGLSEEAIGDSRRGESPDTKEAKPWPLPAMSLRTGDGSAKRTWPNSVRLASPKATSWNSSPIFL